MFAIFNLIQLISIISILVTISLVVPDKKKIEVAIVFLLFCDHLFLSKEMTIH